MSASMITTLKQQNGSGQLPECATHLLTGAHAGDRRQADVALAELKGRLLQSSLTAGDRANSRLLRLAAVEAEALAWQASFPTLLLPTLLEEKVGAMRHYLAVQASLRKPSTTTVMTSHPY